MESRQKELLLAQLLLFWRGTYTFNVLSACWVDHNSQVETMFMFLRNPQGWWHSRMMWTRSPFHAYSREWVWAICIPDQTEKETNQKLHGSVISIQLQIWSLLFKESEKVTPTGVRLNYVASFLLEFLIIIRSRVCFRNCFVYIHPSLFAVLFLNDIVIFTSLI